MFLQKMINRGTIQLKEVKLDAMDFYLSCPVC